MPRIKRDPAAPWYTGQWKAPLPAGRVADIAFIYDPTGRRLIAPWQRSAQPSYAQSEQLHAVMSRVEVLRPAAVVWMWSDARAPEPVQNADPRWLARWSEGKAIYTRP